MDIVVLIVIAVLFVGFILYIGRHRTWGGGWDDRGPMG